jgi:hypothetical protein
LHRNLTFSLALWTRLLAAFQFPQPLLTQSPIPPAWTGRFTSYRYYTLDQLPRLNRILALKDLGFSLEQMNSLPRKNLHAPRHPRQQPQVLT